MRIIATWFWLLAIHMIALNGFLAFWRVKSEKYRSPERSQHYLTLIIMIVVALSIPWLVVGILTQFGYIDSLFDIFCRTDNKTGKYTTMLSIIAVDAAACYWIFWGDGAVELSAYPAIIGQYFSPRAIKLITLGALAAQAIALLTSIAEVFAPPPMP